MGKIPGRRHSDLEFTTSPTPRAVSSFSPSLYGDSGEKRLTPNLTQVQGILLLLPAASVCLSVEWVAALTPGQGEWRLMLEPGTWAERLLTGTRELGFGEQASRGLPGQWGGFKLHV